MTMTPSDVMAMCNGGCNGGNMWNNPTMLLWAMLFGFGGPGVGYGRGGGIQDAEIMGKLNALSGQIQDNQNTNALAGAINSNHDFLHSFNNGMNMGFAGTNAAINAAAQGNLMGQKDLQAAIQSCCCNNQTAILQQTNVLQSIIENVRQATVAGFANIGYALSQQTNDLQKNDDQNTQRILDKMCSDTTQNLRDKLAEMSQAAQTANIVNQLKAC